jgi:hypothetical protein
MLHVLTVLIGIVCGRGWSRRKGNGAGEYGGEDDAQPSPHVITSIKTSMAGQQLRDMSWTSGQEADWTKD